MAFENFFPNIFPALGAVGLTLLWIFIFWEAIWKAIGLWKAGRNNHLVWFLFIFIFNTLGILPIIYLAFFQPKNKKKKR